MVRDARFTGIPTLGADPETVVVIDVMRAFTVAAWAFAGGAERILLASGVEHALALKAAHPTAVTCKDGPPAAGFDTVNSPALVSKLDLRGRTLVQTTTSGTRGALAARHARRVLCAGFAVAAATACTLRADGSASVTYLITGDDGTAEEDRACAEYIAALLENPQTSAGPFLQRARTSAAADTLTAGVRRGYRGIHPDDVALCLQADRFAFAMEVDYRDGTAVLRPVVPRLTHPE
ncbi:2-phosphosulfolactate phosphatase [Couchioplanes caeruleus]|uniref:Probable 2-phosphosulfolactate phosphatase n=2 Tax=Couchioplanes caeruleus TaxID=56438 RepID=A0A1K0GPX5_9ACTN|nr:2-phosphosulfolactate phosphatase [Couchioplanes caeruleus]OJF14454.1 2-phosphosulfolactate phosphatase [Couchioplanes caeruleus subsp. caeruleus]ROP33991.1 2-phosphosulfolactate phosphatase [Couchioplanes caeruleus]